MLVPGFSWYAVKSAVTCTESDCLARVRTSPNSLAWYDVFLRESDGHAYLKRYGRYEAIDGLAGFEGYERIKTKLIFDTSRGMAVDTGVLVGSV